MMSEHLNCNCYLFNKNTVKSLAKIWYYRTSLIVCANFAKIDITYFKRITPCFKPVDSWFEKSMAYFTVRKNFLESRKRLLSITKFLLCLFQEKDFLFQTKICLGRFLVSKKWLI